MDKNSVVSHDEDERMKDPTSLGKRDHEETIYEDEDCHSVYKNDTEGLSQELMTQLTSQSELPEINSEVLQELQATNMDRSKRVNIGRDLTADPQSTSPGGTPSNSSI